MDAEIERLKKELAELSAIVKGSPATILRKKPGPKPKEQSA